MNYIELCNSLHEKTGESGADLTAVVGLSGYQKKIANLIKRSWTEIQSLHTEWRFLRLEALPTVTVGLDNIDADDWCVSNLDANIDEYSKNSFSIYLTATGVSDETDLIYVPFEKWKGYFGTEYDDGTQGRPTHITIKPSDDTLQIGPVADDSYTLSFEFLKAPDILTNTSDVPCIASSLHEVITWRALEMYGYREESKYDIEEGHKNYIRLLRRLESRELPELTIGPPLA